MTYLDRPHGEARVEAPHGQSEAERDEQQGHGGFGSSAHPIILRTERKRGREKLRVALLQSRGLLLEGREKKEDVEVVYDPTSSVSA